MPPPLSALPALQSWLPSDTTRHPLHQLLVEDDAGSRAILQAFDGLIATVEKAAPRRWEGKRREFRAVNVEQRVLQVRSELAIAAKLVRGSVSFGFGEEGKPNPDLVLDSGLGIEVTTRAPQGLWQLYDEVEDVLRTSPRCSVALRFSEYPLRIPAAVRGRLVSEIREIAEQRDATDKGGIARERFTDSRNPGPIDIQAIVFPVPRLAHGYRVTWETDSTELGPQMTAARAEVFDVLNSARKQAQARSMPTILVVDIGRLVQSWLRPPRIWAQDIGANLPMSCPFVAIAVCWPSLDAIDCELSLTITPAASPADVTQIEKLAIAIGLDGWAHP